MSTRCIIAEPHGDGWRGRYSHWDGYPDSKLPDLTTLVLRDGVEKVRAVLLHLNHSWSSIDPDAEYGVHYGRDDLGYVKGYGFAHTDMERNEAFFTQSDKDFAWAEYLYILGDKAIFYATAEGGKAEDNLGWSTLTEHSYTKGEMK